MSSGASLMPRGSRLRNSQNSRMASSKARAQAVDVRAALRGRDQVDVAFGDHLAAVGQPLHRPVHRLVPAAEAGRERYSGSSGRSTSAVARYSSGRLVQPLVGALVIGEADAQARAQHRLGAQQVAQPRDQE